MPPPTRNQIFISYSHKDERWRDELETHLKPYLRDGSIISWSDKQITPGSEWFREIQSALTNSKVAVLLVSPDFIASHFIHEHELGPLLEEAEQGGVKILWVPVYDSPYKQTALKRYQAVLDASKPLGGMTKAKRARAWVRICEEIQKGVKESAGATQISTVLPKTLYLKTAEGMKKIAEDGVPLPARRVIRGSKSWDDSTFDVDVYQEDEKISTIEVGDLPSDAGTGSRVIITVEITQKNEMKGTVAIHSRTDTLLAKRNIHFQFPPLRLPSPAELRAQFDELELKRQELEALSSDPDQRLLLAGKGEKLSRKLTKLFSEMDPDKQEILVAIKQLDQLVNPPPDDMNPPKAEFRRLVENCRDLLEGKLSESGTQPLQQMLERIENDGNDAATTKNHKKWAATNESLVKLYARIEKVSGKGDDSTEESLPPTVVLKEQGRRCVDRLRSKARAKGEASEHEPRYIKSIKPRLEKIQKSLDQMVVAIDKIDDNAPPKQGLALVQSALTRAPQLEQEIEKVTSAMEGVTVTEID